jgi:hypothetical protein
VRDAADNTLLLGCQLVQLAVRQVDQGFTFEFLRDLLLNQKMHQAGWIRLPKVLVFNSHIVFKVRQQSQKQRSVT